MDLVTRYNEKYNQLAALRKFVEHGIILSSVNFWRDSIQGLKELDLIENKEMFFSKYEAYFQDAFIQQFFTEEFPEVEGKINMVEAGSIMQMIHEVEGDKTYELFQECLLAYATEIAKASKEDWLSFIGLKDNISDKEADFINNLKVLLNSN
jgi:hypothetical protein